MSKPLTRKEACETYEQRWMRQHLTEEQWDETLNLMYEGKTPTEIIRALQLNPQCTRSLTAHARRHRGYIAFMRGVRLKDKRMQLAATLSDAWRALIEKVFAIAMDDSTRPGIRMQAATVATAEQKVGELKKVLEAKGVTLGDEADFVAIINAAIAQLEGTNKETEGEAASEEAAVAASVRVELGLGKDADKDVIVKALAELKGHIGYVPAAEG